jgi:hypothetical protein
LLKIRKMNIVENKRGDVENNYIQKQFENNLFCFIITSLAPLNTVQIIEFSNLTNNLVKHNYPNVNILS